MSGVLVCFAAHIGRAEGAFAELLTVASAVEAATTWAATLPVSPEELADAADILTGGREPERAPNDSDGPDVDLERVLAELAMESGKTVEYWMTQTSPIMVAALRAVNAKRAAAIGATIQADDGAAERMRDLLWCVERIKQRAEADNGPQ